MAATHIINRTPSAILTGKMPYELLSGSPPDYAHFFVFGSFCFAKRVQRDKDKFQDRSIRCIFLGYESGKKGWIVYDLDKGAKFVSRDVIFHEDTFPFASIDIENQGKDPKQIIESHPAVFDAEGESVVFSDVPATGVVSFLDIYVGADTVIEPPLFVTGNRRVILEQRKLSMTLFQRMLKSHKYLLSLRLLVVDIVLSNNQFCSNRMLHPLLNSSTIPITLHSAPIKRLQLNFFIPKPILFHMIVSLHYIRHFWHPSMFTLSQKHTWKQLVIHVGKTQWVSRLMLWRLVGIGISRLYHLESMRLVPSWCLR